MLGSNEDSLEADCLFESAVDAVAAESSSVNSYVDVGGKEVIAIKIVFSVASCLRQRVRKTLQQWANCGNTQGKGDP